MVTLDKHFLNDNAVLMHFSWIQLRTKSWINNKFETQMDQSNKWYNSINVVEIGCQN